MNICMLLTINTINVRFTKHFLSFSLDNVLSNSSAMAPIQRIEVACAVERIRPGHLISSLRYPSQFSPSQSVLDVWYSSTRTTPWPCGMIPSYMHLWYSICGTIRVKYL